MNNIEDNYITSKDYDLLYELLMKDCNLVGFVDYKYFNDDKVYRDVVKIRHYKENDCHGAVKISSRGISFDSGVFYMNNPEKNKEVFLKDCISNNLSFITPSTVI